MCGGMFARRCPERCRTAAPPTNTAPLFNYSVEPCCMTFYNADAREAGARRLGMLRTVAPPAMLRFLPPFLFLDAGSRRTAASQSGGGGTHCRLTPDKTAARASSTAEASLRLLFATPLRPAPPKSAAAAMLQAAASAAPAFAARLRMCSAGRRHRRAPVPDAAPLFRAKPPPPRPRPCCSAV